MSRKIRLNRQKRDKGITGLDKYALLILRGKSGLYFNKLDIDILSEWRGGVFLDRIPLLESIDSLDTSFLEFQYNCRANIVLIHTPNDVLVYDPLRLLGSLGSFVEELTEGSSTRILRKERVSSKDIKFMVSLASSKWKEELSGLSKAENLYYSALMLYTVIFRSSDFDVSEMLKDKDRDAMIALIESTGKEINTDFKKYFEKEKKDGVVYD